MEGPYLHKYLIGQDGYRDQQATQVPIKAANDIAMRLIRGRNSIIKLVLIILDNDRNDAGENGVTPKGMNPVDGLFWKSI